MKKLRLLLGLALLVGGVYVAFMVFPPYFANFRFQDVLESEARSVTYGASRKTDDDIRDIIFKKAQELNVPVQPAQIKVDRTGSEVLITADYTVHVDLPLYPLDLDFHTSSKKQ